MILIRDFREVICTGIRRATRRRRIPGVIFVVLAILTASPLATAGELDKVILFDIEAQNLDKALLQFGAQAHVQMSVEPTADLLRLRTEKLKGRYTGRAALARLLKGTRLRYVVAGNTLAIQPSTVVETTHAPVPGSPSHPESKHSTTAGRGLSDPPETNRRSSTRQSTYGLREVIVTAQKYRQAALDVPISLVVIGSQQLQEDHIETLNDLQYEVPGLRVEGGGAQQRIIIRGVGNDVGNGAYVSNYIDDADVTSSGYSGATGYGGTNLQTYDLARVEVLRGPQGTLYGDSALGGTIRLITNPPMLNTFEMNSNVELPFTQYGAPSQHVEAMLNAPIADTFAVRAAGEFDHDGGWVDEPVAGLKNINDDNMTDARIQGLWEPLPELNVRVMQMVHREAYGFSQGEDVNGNFTPPFNTTSTPDAQKHFDLSNVTLTYTFAGMRLLGSSTYLDSDEDLNNYSTNQIGAATVLEPSVRDTEKKFSQEVRLASTGAGPLRWTVGGFYDHDRSGLVNGIEYIGLYSVPATLASTSTAIQLPGESQLQGSTSWAAFGDTSYTLADHLTLGAGVRYYRDRETASGSTYPESPSATFSSTDPRVYVEYKVTSRLNTYVSASKGFRTGGFNPYVSPYGPESLWNYEFGTKMQVGNRLVWNADVFWSNYSNYVAFAILPTVSSLFGEDYNIGDARIRGVEGEVDWRPSSGWLMSFSGDYIDAKIISIESSAFDTAYNVGDQVPLSSKYQFSAAIERDIEWNDRLTYVRAAYSQLSPQVNYRPLEYSDSIRMLGLEAGVQWTGNLRLGAFAKNLLNDRGLLDPFADLSVASRPRPRTYGIDFSVGFDGR